MNPLFSLIPAPYRWLILAALLVVYGGVCFYRGASFEQRRADQREAAAAVAAMKTQVAAVTAARAEEHRKTDAVAGVANEIRKQLDASRVAESDNRAAGERLRGQLATACNAGGSAAQSATAGGSAPADAATGVLADVQRRLAEAEDRTVEFADRSRIAGLGCERAYEALTPVPSTPNERQP